MVVIVSTQRTIIPLRHIVFKLIYKIVDVIPYKKKCDDV